MSNYREKWFENNSSNHGWYKCVRCGKKLRKNEVDIDHIIPRHRGGSDKLNNLQCMCRTCNRSKQDDMGLHTVSDYTRNNFNIASKNINKVSKNIKNSLDGLLKSHSKESKKCHSK